jgi:hypothetical protein
MARRTAGRRWFARLLRLLPFETRRDYGADMEQAFAADRAETDRAGGCGARPCSASSASHGASTGRRPGSTSATPGADGAAPRCSSAR